VAISFMPASVAKIFWAVSFFALLKSFCSVEISFSSAIGFKELKDSSSSFISCFTTNCSCCFGGSFEALLLFKFSSFSSFFSCSSARDKFLSSKKGSKIGFSL